MKRFWYVCVVALVVLGSGVVPVASTAAQATTLSPEDLVLRIAEDQHWIYTPNGSRELAQVIDGEPQRELNPATGAFYKEHNVRSVYIYSASIRPANNIYDTISTGIETRVITFENADDAALFQANFFDSMNEDDLATNNGQAQYQLMHQLPSTPYPTVGWTMQDSYFSSNGDPLGNASGVRFMAQHETTVVAMRVVGPFVDFNFDLATALFEYQLECVAANAACDPVSISEVTPSWQFVMRTLFYVNDASERASARFVFPVEEPVRAPEMGATFEANASGENTTSATTPGTSSRTVRTTSRSDSSPTRVTRTTRTSSSNESPGTTPVRRVTRESTTSTDPESANATVIAVSADVFTEPDASSDVIVTLEQDARVTVTADPEVFDGTIWVPVVTESGEQGWMSPADLWKD